VKVAAIAASAVLAGGKRTRALTPSVSPVVRHCFVRGTTILTAQGGKRIEDLAVGDFLPTVFGRMRPIQWIGRYPFKKGDWTTAWVEDVLPVRVVRSAFGPDVPNADLLLSGAHALLLDGVLVPVANLINGTTIAVWDARALEELEYFHIKLEAHDVIYAEGVPCETLRNVDENAVNFAEYLRMYGHPACDSDLCAPLIRSGRRIEVTSRLRSAISPWFDCRQKFDVIRDKLEEGEPVFG
jgi:hypothetical protein